MKTASTLFLAALLSACAVFAPENLGPDAARRDGLWRQGHAAMQRDSFRVAIAAFQRLAVEHPRSDFGREALFYLGTLYLAADTAGGRVTRRPEAEMLLGLSRQLALPCEQRTGSLRCDPQVVTRPGGSDTVVVRQGSDQSGEISRLRRELAERDGTIRELREELQRIRNTLAPRPE